MRKIVIVLAILFSLGFTENALFAQAVVVDDAREKWRSATDYVRTGEPRKALPLLEYLVTVAPENIEVRLELALAYFKIRDNQKAKFHFEQTLNSRLDENRRKLVLQYLRAIEDRRTWTASLSFSLVPETNASNRTSSETINLGGFDFVLNEVAESGTGANLNARLIYTPRISRDTSARFSIAGSCTAFKETIWNDYTLRGEAGLIHRGDLDRELSYGLFISQRWLGDKPFSSEFGGFSSFTTRIGLDTKFVFRGEIAERKAPNLLGRNGSVYSMNASIVKTLSPRFNLQARSFIVKTDAIADFESGTSIGIGLGASYLFKKGWRTNANVTYSRENKSGKAPIFNVARQETQLDLKLQLLNRKLQWHGFTPALEIGHERRQSNISLFSFENNYFSVGFTRDF